MLSSLVVAALGVLVQAQCPCYIYTDPSFMACDDPSLTSIPDCVADDITKLRLTSPLVPLVKETFSRFKQLQVLMIEEIDYPRFAKNFLEGHQFLEYFEIYDTGLTYVDNEWFMYSPRIKTLKLWHNHINSLSADTFNYLPMLEHVDLSINYLTTLPPTLFEGTFVKFIDLSSNQWSCDCEIATIVQWTRDRGVFLGEGAHCANPVDLAGLPLSYLTPEIGCKK